MKRVKQVNQSEIGPDTYKRFLKPAKQNQKKNSPIRIQPSESVNTSIRPGI